MAELNTYIFDCSVEGQFTTEEDSKDAISGILLLVSLLEDAQNVIVYVSYDKTALYQSIMTANVTFGTVLDRNRDLRRLWDMKLTRFISLCNVPIVAYDDVVKKEIVSLLCIKDSSYKEPEITLFDANGNNPRKVISWVCQDTLAQFMKSKNWLRTYSDSTKYPPRDEQTILADTALFRLTTYHNHKRKVYERIGTEEYWCCDNFHSGRSAELEVFRKSDLSHIGTCGIFDINTFSTAGAVPGRVMDNY